MSSSHPPATGSGFRPDGGFTAASTTPSPFTGTGYSLNSQTPNSSNNQQSSSTTSSSVATNSARHLKVKHDQAVHQLTIPSIHTPLTSVFQSFLQTLSLSNDQTAQQRGNGQWSLYSTKVGYIDVNRTWSSSGLQEGEEVELKWRIVAVSNLPSSNSTAANTPQLRIAIQTSSVASLSVDSNRVEFSLPLPSPDQAPTLFSLLLHASALFPQLKLFEAIDSHGQLHLFTVTLSSVPPRTWDLAVHDQLLQLFSFDIYQLGILTAAQQNKSTAIMLRIIHRMNTQMDNKLTVDEWNQRVQHLELEKRIKEEERVRLRKEHESKIEAVRKQREEERLLEEKAELALAEEKKLRAQARHEANQLKLAGVNAALSTIYTQIFERNEQTSNAELYLSILNTFITICKNLINFPQEKYRCINPTAKRVIPVPACVDFLCALGFEHKLIVNPVNNQEEEKLILKDKEDMQLTQMAIGELETRIEKFKEQLAVSNSQQPSTSSSNTSTTSLADSNNSLPNNNDDESYSPASASNTSSSSSSGSSSSIFLDDNDVKSSSSSSSMDTSSKEDENTDWQKPDLSPEYNISDVRSALQLLKEELIIQEMKAEKEQTSSDEQISISPDMKLSNVQRELYLSVANLLSKITSNLIPFSQTKPDPTGSSSSYTFRLLSLSNPKVAKLLVPYEGARKYMSFLGFQVIERHQVPEESDKQSSPTNNEEDYVFYLPQSYLYSLRFSRAHTILQHIISEYDFTTDELEQIALGPLVDRQQKVFYWDPNQAAAIFKKEREEREAKSASLENNAEDTPASSASSALAESMNDVDEASSSSSASDSALLLRAMQESKLANFHRDRQDIVITKTKLAELKAQQRRKYHETLIKIISNELNIMITAYFRPWETLQSVLTFIREHLVQGNSINFSLRAPPNTKFSSSPSTQTNQSLSVLGLTPASTLYFTFESTTSSTPISLQLLPEIQAKVEPYFSQNVPVAANKDQLEKLKLKALADMRQQQALISQREARASYTGRNADADAEDMDMEQYMAMKKKQASKKPAWLTGKK